MRNMILAVALLVGLQLGLLAVGNRAAASEETEKSGVMEVPDSDGWWCESQAGTCVPYKFGCEDQSCHWRLHAWVVFYYERQAYQAFETETLCIRARRKFDIPSEECRRLRLRAE